MEVAVVELEHETIMAVVVPRPNQGPGHAEVQQQRGRSIGATDEQLSVSARAREAAASQRPSDARRGRVAQHAAVDGAYALDALALGVAREGAAEALDVWKLGHAAVVPATRDSSSNSGRDRGKTTAAASRALVAVSEPKPPLVGGDASRERDQLVARGGEIFPRQPR